MISCIFLILFFLVVLASFSLFADQFLRCCPFYLSKSFFEIRMWSLVHWLPKSSFPVVRERTFFIEKGWGVGRGFGWEGGGGAGALDGRVLSKFFTNWEGQTCLFSTGGGSQFFWQGKNYSMSLLFCIYKQSYQSRLI